MPLNFLMRDQQAIIYLGLCFVPFCDIKSLLERLGSNNAHGRSLGRSQKSWN